MTQANTTTAKATAKATNAPKLSVKMAAAKKAKATKAKAQRKLAATIAAAKEAAHKPLHMMAKENKTLLHILRADCVTAAKRGQGITRLYASGLIREFGAGFWKVSSQQGVLSPNENALRKAVRAEQRACLELAKSRGLSNPHKPWSDAKAICMNPTGEKVKASERPFNDRLNAAILAAYAIAYRAAVDLQDDVAFMAIYERLGDLVKRRKISTVKLTAKQ
jgi:hypothetical protein